MVPGGASSRSREIVSFDIDPVLLHLTCRSNRLYAPHSVVRCGSSFRRKSTSSAPFATSSRTGTCGGSHRTWARGRTSSGGFGGQYVTVVAALELVVVTTADVPAFTVGSQIRG